MLRKQIAVTRQLLAELELPYKTPRRLYKRFAKLLSV
jgi:hypothetical protein